jgi:phosphate transport system permease protein
MADRPAHSDGGDGSSSGSLGLPANDRGNRTDGAASAGVGAGVLPPPSIAGESIVAAPMKADGADSGPDIMGVDEAPPGSHIEFGTPPVIGSSQPTAIDTLPDAPPVAGSGSLSGGAGSGKVRIGDRIFSSLAIASGGLIIALVALIAIFLLIQAVPAIADDKANFLLSRHWNISGSVLDFGVLTLLWTTVVVSLIAMLIAVPISIGIALFISFYAPKSMARPVAYIIDLLAAIPSIVYGIWGIAILAPHLTGLQRVLYHLGIGVFSDNKVLTGSIFDGSIVLAVMILPIITAISRDVFERTPRYNIEAAWALGATRWEMIRLAVLPFGRPGVISASMLGLGRALGETIAISLILSAPASGAPFSWSIFSGGETFASKIANNAAEFGDPKSTGAYIAAGLVLFVLTFIVNAAARAIVNRRKDFI